jgi:hypothetical protein
VKKESLLALPRDKREKNNDKPKRSTGPAHLLNLKYFTTRFIAGGNGITQNRNSHKFTFLLMGRKLPVDIKDIAFNELFHLRK